VYFVKRWKIELLRQFVDATFFSDSRSGIVWFGCSFLERWRRGLGWLTTFPVPNLNLVLVKICTRNAKRSKICAIGFQASGKEITHIQIYNIIKYRDNKKFENSQKLKFSKKSAWRGPGARVGITNKNRYDKKWVQKHGVTNK